MNKIISCNSFLLSVDSRFQTEGMKGGTLLNHLSNHHYLNFLFLPCLSLFNPLTVSFPSHFWQERRERKRNREERGKGEMILMEGKMKLQRNGMDEEDSHEVIDGITTDLSLFPSFFLSLSFSLTLRTLEYTIL